MHANISGCSLVSSLDFSIHRLHRTMIRLVNGPGVCLPEQPNKAEWDHGVIQAHVGAIHHWVQIYWTGPDRKSEHPCVADQLLSQQRRSSAVAAQEGAIHAHDQVLHDDPENLRAEEGDCTRIVDRDAGRDVDEDMHDRRHRECRHDSGVSGDEIPARHPEDIMHEKVGDGREFVGVGLVPNATVVGLAFENIHSIAICTVQYIPPESSQRVSV